MYSEEFCKAATAMATRTGDYLLEFYRLDEDNLQHVRTLSALAEIFFNDDDLSVDPKFVLDMGCGTGEFLYQFLNIHPNYYGFGVNLFGSQFLPDLPGNIRLVEGNIEDPSTWGSGQPQKFDTIFMNYVSGHVDVSKVFAVAQSLLKDDGVFIMWDLYPRVPYAKEIAGYALRTPWEMRLNAIMTGFKTFDFRLWPNCMHNVCISPGVQRCLPQEDIDTFKRLTAPVLYLMTNKDGHDRQSPTGY